MTRLLAGVAVLLIAAAPAGASGPPQALSQKCGDHPGVEAQPFWITTSDGVPLYSIEAGSGSTAVVLSHESPANLCGWLPYIPSLTSAGIRVLAFDLRGFGDSIEPRSADPQGYDRDLAAVVARARADGAKRVFLMGASYGAATSMTYAPRLPVDGVISLSGEIYLPSAKANPYIELPHLRVPLLIVGTRHDRSVPVPDALKMLRRAGTKDKRTALYPGGWHGWAIVEAAPYAARARALILGWIRARAQ